MAKTKGDLVLKALRKAGLYSNATLTDADPQAIEDAINDLEDMMAAWQAKGIELGYQFADTENGIMPLPDDDSGTRVLLLRRRRVDLVRQPQAINWLRSRRHSVSLGYQTR